MKPALLLIVPALLATAAPAAARPDDQFSGDAKAAARNTVSLIESCSVDTGSYAKCGEDVLQAIDGALPWRRITIDRRTASRYRVRSTSVTGATFTITRGPHWSFERTCTPAGSAGCSKRGRW